MKIDVRHTFDCTLEQFWASWWSEELDAQLQSKSRIERRTLEETTEGGRVTKRQRIVLPVQPPRMVRKLIGSDELSYDQISTTDQANGKVTWHIDPPAAKDRVKATGTVRIFEEGGKVVRHLVGEISIGVPLVGSSMEQQIVQGIVDGHEEDAVVRTAWLAKQFG